MKSPFGFDLDKNIGGETFDEQIFNTFVRNEGGTTTVTSPITCTLPDFTNPNMRDFANALQAHTYVVQDLVQSVEGLAAAIKLMKDKTVFKGTCASMKAHNKKNEEIQRLRD